MLVLKRIYEKWNHFGGNMETAVGIEKEEKYFKIAKERIVNS